MGKKQIQNTLKIIIKRVTEKYNPEKVLLFGSYANKDATDYSDIDILVVSRAFKTKDPYSRYVELHRLLADLDPDVNAFGFTPQEVENTEDSITLKEALSTGVVIHQKTS